METLELIERLIMKKRSLEKDKTMFKFDNLTNKLLDNEILILGETIEKLRMLGTIECFINSFINEFENNLNNLKFQLGNVIKDNGKE